MHMNAHEPSIRILTNHVGQKESLSWRHATTYVTPQGFGMCSSLLSAFKLFLKRKSFDCVVLGAGRNDFWYAIFQTLLPVRKVPCIKVDCLWYKSPNRIRQFLKKLGWKIASRSIHTFVVWARREIEAYSHTFGIPKKKFTFIPYHTTLDIINISHADGDYIFSGGNFGRDYETLIEAVRGLDIKVCIGSTRLELFHHISLPSNIEIRGYTHETFLNMMAGCRINVVSLDSTLLHSGGQQTFLNSMWLGKPTIVNDPDGAADYITHGEDGWLVPPRDTAALRAAIVMLWNNPEKAKQLGFQASKKARKYTTEEHFKRIINLAATASDQSSAKHSNTLRIKGDL